MNNPQIKALYVLLLWLFVFYPKINFGQGYRLKSARQHFAVGNYSVASEYYKTLLEKEPENVYYLNKLAECYKELAEYRKAEETFSKVLKGENLPDDYYLHFAQVLANNKKYRQSKAMYEVYAKLKKDVLAELIATKYDNVEEFYANSNKFKIGITSINSSLSDFSPMFYNQGLVFISNRRPPLLNTGIDARDDTPYLDYYFVRDTSRIYIEAIRNSNSWNIVNTATTYSNDDLTKETSNDSKTLGGIKNVFDDTTQFSKCLVHTPAPPFSSALNTQYHEGPMSFTPNFDTIYFTRNTEPPSKSGLGKKKSSQLKIYWATINHNKWTEMGEFPFNTNDFSCGHPAMTPDGKSIYFVSNMAGGFGGTDIYRTDFENGHWLVPRNLGDNINTNGNEMFPYIDQAGSLFFASDGHPGLGGLDVFQTEISSDYSLPVKNLGNPINSSYDDFGLIYDNQHSQGYFSSNRMRGVYDDDIYHFSYSSNEQSVIVRGNIYEDGTRNGINKAVVYLKNGSEVDSSLTDINGYYIFPIETGKQYLISAVRKGYSESEIMVSTLNMKRGLLQTIIVDTSLYLVKKPIEEQLSEFDDYEFKNALNNVAAIKAMCDTLGNEFHIGNIYFDINKYFVRTVDQPELTKVVKLLKKYKTAQLLISAHTDTKNASDYNILLSKKRALTLYYSLISRGIRKERINYEFRNETMGNIDEGSPDKNQYSRRAEFYIILNGINVTKSCHLVPGPETPIPQQTSTGKKEPKEK